MSSVHSWAAIQTAKRVTGGSPFSGRARQAASSSGAVAAGQRAHAPGAGGQATYERAADEARPPGYENVGHGSTLSADRPIEGV